MPAPGQGPYVAFPEERRNSAGVLIDALPKDKQKSSGRYQSVGKSGSQVSTELPYEFADPCPESMRAVNISDLSGVNINWKMLTLARPDNKTDEEIFSKYVY